MRKLLVKIFNIVYIAAALFAILSLCFEPLFKLSLDINIQNSSLVALVDKSNEPSSASTGMIKRDASSADSNEEESNIVEIIKRIGDVQTEEPLVIEIPSKVYFDFKNQSVLKEVIMENVDSLTLQLSQLLGTKLKTAIEGYAKDKAGEILGEQISNQIAQYYKGGGTAPVANQEDVDQIVENVYALFETNEKTTTSELTNTIMGKNYSLADPQPTSLDDLKEKSYYLKDGDKYIRDHGDAEEFDPHDGQYYVVEYSTGVCTILQDLEGTEGFETIDYDNLDTSEIEKAMVDSLESMPGLTEASYIEVEMNAEKFAAQADEYYVLDASGSYVLATEFDENAQYFVKEVIVKNVDDALAALLGTFLPSKGLKKKGLSEEEKAEEASELDKKVQQILKDLIHVDAITDFAQKTVTKYTPLILTGIFILFAFPWAFFAIKTLIRTLRRRKCWCKFLVVFIFAFIQLVLGAVITLGLRFGTAKVLDVVKEQTSSNPAAANAVSLLSSCKLKIAFGCLMASYVYIGMFVTSIVYVIIARRVKFDYKYDKKLEKREKKAAKRFKQRVKTEGAQSLEE